MRVIGENVFCYSSFYKQSDYYVRDWHVSMGEQQAAFFNMAQIRLFIRGGYRRKRAEETCRKKIKKTKRKVGLGLLAFQQKLCPAFVGYALNFIDDVHVLWREQVPESALSLEVCFHWFLLLRCQCDEFAGC